MSNTIEGYITKIEETGEEIAHLRITIAIAYPYMRRPTKPNRKHYSSEDVYDRAMMDYENEMRDYKEMLATCEQIKKLHIGRVEIIQNQEVSP